MGKLKLSVFLAYKSIIKGSRWTLAMIIIVMSLSFANLILTPSILSGVTQTFNKQQVDALLSNVIIDPPENAYYLDNTSQIENKLEQYPGVTAVSSHLGTGAFFEYDWLSKTNPDDKGKSGNWKVIGINPEKESQVTTIKDNIIEGSYLVPGDRDQVILGVDIAGGGMSDSSSFLNLGGVHTGDKVRLTFSNGVQREYYVKGIFRAREGEADRLAFVTNEEMVSVLGRSAYSNRATQILVKTRTSQSESEFLTGLNTLGIDGQIRSWTTYGSGVSGVISSFKIVTSLIGSIGLIVAAVVMFIVIYINVLHKRRQIGIMRAIGINQRVILYSYVLQALFYAALGIIIGGLAFGYALQPYFAAHPLDLSIGFVSLKIDMTTVRNSVIGILAAAVLAGIIPVVSITRQSIIKAIWGN